jgi:hypothetical protein
LLARVSLDSGYHTLVRLPRSFLIAKPHLNATTADAVLTSNLNIPLKGIAIGNGWIDPKTQYKSYLDYLVKMGILEENSAVRGFPLFAATATVTQD